MATTTGTTNRITLRIGVVFDEKALDAKSKQLAKEYDTKYANIANKGTKAMNEQGKAVTSTNKEIKKQKTLVGELTSGWEKTVANFLKFTVIASASMALTVSLKQMKDLIFELDTALTNLSIVTGANATELEMVSKRATELTTSLGALKGEIINSITEFARAGYDLADSMFLAEKATMAANVGFTELDKVTTFIIAGLKSFQLEAEGATRIMDVLFQVSNKTAVDLEGIGEAFLRSANTLKVAGATLEESAALISAANESIQDPAKVGTALKTIASRLRGIGDEGEVVPTLAKDFKAVGVEIQNADGSFRNIYDVFQDFAKVYTTLDDLTKESLLEKLAGKRQKNILIGLLDNFDVAQMALEEAINSTGSVAEANEKYLDSLEGKTKVLTETWGEFLRQLGDSEAMKGFVDLLTLFIKGLTLATNGMLGLATSVGLLFTGLSALMPLFTGAITLATGGVGLLIPVLAVAIGSLIGYNSITGLTKDTTDELTDSTKKLTEAQRENQQVIEGSNIKAQKELADELQRQIDIIDELKKLYEDLSNSAPKDSVFGSNLGIQEFTTELSKTNKAISEAEQQLANMGFTVQEAKDYIKSLGDEVIALTDAQLDNAEANFQVKQIVSGTSDEYQILSDALQQLEIDGYLTDDMLNTLISTYPDLVAVTGLQIDKVREYLTADEALKKQLIESAKSNATTAIKQAEVVIESYRAQIDAIRAYSLAVGGGSYGVGYALIEANKNIELQDKIIQDSKNNIALLDNELKQLDSTDKGRTEAIKKSREEQEDSNKVLTAQERILRDINQQIALLQKEYARTDDAENQIRINEELIAQYQLQKVAIMNVRAEFIESNKGLKEGTDKYDDYIDKLYAFSLQVEDATNNIFSLTSANFDLANSIDEVKKANEEANLKDLTKELNEYIDEQTRKIKLLKEQRDAYYDSAIKSAQDDIDNYNKQNELLDNQVKLQELLMNLQEARERRANILANKNVRLVKDSEVGFEFVADPRALREAEDAINDAEKSIADFRTSVSQKAEQDRLESIKSNLEAQRDAELDSYDKSIQDWETFNSGLTQLIESGAEVTKEMLQATVDSYGNIEATSYASRLTALDGYITEYNAKLASINSIAAQIDERTTSPTIIPAPTTVLGGGVSSGASGTVTSNAPSTNSLVGKSTPTVNSSNSQTTINTLNVKSDRNDVDAIIRDANAKAKIMKY